VKRLDEYEIEELAELADSDFQGTVQSEARTLVPDAFDTYREVMASSPDDQARLKAADKVISLAGFEEKQSALNSSISEEVFKMALAGLGQLAGIARVSSNVEAILRNVTPAASDPRAVVALPSPSVDDSPLNRKLPDENEEVATILQKERYEIRNPE